MTSPVSATGGMEVRLRPLTSSVSGPAPVSEQLRQFQISRAGELVGSTTAILRSASDLISVERHPRRSDVLSRVEAADAAEEILRGLEGIDDVFAAAEERGAARSLVSLADKLEDLLDEDASREVLDELGDPIQPGRHEVARLDLPDRTGARAGPAPRRTARRRGVRAQSVAGRSREPLRGHQQRARRGDRDRPGPCGGRDHLISRVRRSPRSGTPS